MGIFVKYSSLFFPNLISEGVILVLGAYFHSLFAVAAFGFTSGPRE